MQCIICKQGKTKSGTTTVTLQRGDSTIIIKDVPAEICENCGEYYLSETITERILKMAEDSIQKGTEIGIIRFAA